MAAKLPVVASNFPLWKEIVEKNHCGVTVDPLDVNAIVEGIRSILDTPDRIAIMGRNGYEAVCRSYNWENEENKLIEVYKKNLA
jgi:glycosyltransferase involved in cell wall biosynthesis